MTALEQICKRREKLKEALAELDIAERVLLSLNGTESVQDTTKSGASTPASLRPIVNEDGTGMKIPDAFAAAVRQNWITRSKPFASKSITDCAAAILESADGDMHDTEIADAALAKGYESTRATDDPKKSARHSFWAMMKRHPEIFDSTGKGRFRLKRKGKQTE